VRRHPVVDDGGLAERVGARHSDPHGAKTTATTPLGRLFALHAQVF